MGRRVKGTKFKGYGTQEYYSTIGWRMRERGGMHVGKKEGERISSDSERKRGGIRGKMRRTRK